MKKENYHRSISAKITADEAMKRISHVNEWWAKKFTGKAEKLNDKFKVDFGETFVDFKVNSFIPGKRVSWLVTDCYLHWINDKKEWNGTEVVFELSEKNGTTTVDFTHVGLVPGVECYNDCEVGWDGHFTGSLLNLLTTGKGQPQ